MVSDSEQLKPVMLLHNDFLMDDKSARYDADVRVLTYWMPTTYYGSQRVSVHFMNGYPKMVVVIYGGTDIRSSAIKTVGQLRMALALAGLEEVKIVNP